MVSDKHSNNEFVKFIKLELELFGYSIKLQGTYEVLSQLTCNYPWNICKAKNVVFSDFFKVIDNYVFSGNDLFDLQLSGLSRKHIYGIKTNNEFLLSKFFVALSCDVLINSSSNILFIEYGQ